MWATLHPLFVQRELKELTYLSVPCPLATVIRSTKHRTDFNGGYNVNISLSELCPLFNVSKIQ